MTGATTIVVADDHPAMLAAVSEILERHGFEIVGRATDGQQALALIDDAIELPGLALGLFDGGIDLFHQRRIVLGHLVHLPDRNRYFLDARCLLAAFPRDAVHQRAALPRRRQHCLEPGRRFRYQL
jgi:DNA-binding NarL/FixJ family response regulator